MTEYFIKFKSSAAKELRNLPSEIKQRLKIALDKLRSEPRPYGVVKLQGDDQLYRIRVGDYRIVYLIDDESKLVRVTRIRHRRDVYKG